MWAQTLTDPQLRRSDLSAFVLERSSLSLRPLRFSDRDHAIDECLPQFTVVRLDNPDSWSYGFNYRYVNKYWGTPAWGNTTGDGPTHYRDLVKVFGVRFLFQVNGQGGKFNFVSLTTSLGAGLGLLGIATIICDFLLQYFNDDQEWLVEQKYQNVKNRRERQSSMLADGLKSADGERSDTPRSLGNDSAYMTLDTPIRGGSKDEPGSAELGLSAPFLHSGGGGGDRGQTGGSDRSFDHWNVPDEDMRGTS